MVATAAGGRAAQEALPVVAAAQALVAEHDHAAIGAAPDQPSEALAQAQHRLREHVLAERVAESFRAGPHERVGRHRERQLGDDHAAERVAGNVDALPEAGGPEQHGAPVGEEAGQDLPAGAVEALAEQRDAARLHALARAGRGRGAAGCTR